MARDERLREAIAVLRPLHEQIVQLGASDVELAMKLEVLVSQKDKTLSGPLLVQAHSYLKQTHELLAFFADRLKVRLREQTVDLPARQLRVLDQCLPHDVEALEDSDVLLTMSWPPEDRIEECKTGSRRKVRHDRT